MSHEMLTRAGYDWPWRRLRRLPLLTVALAAAALVIQCSPGLIEVFCYDRESIGSGQLWRVWSGHLTHWSWDHLAWDLLAFVILGSLCEIASRRRWLLIMTLSALAVCLAVYWGSPQVASYRGLSGVDSALYGCVLAGSVDFRKGGLISTGMKIALLAGLGFIIKVIYEMATGASMFVDSAGVFIAMPSTHLTGFLTGLLVSAVTRPENRKLEANADRAPAMPAGRVATGMGGRG